MKYLMIIMIALVWTVSAQAKLHTEAIEYKHDQTMLEGYLAYDDSMKGKRPGILVVHEWWGLNPYIKKRAEQLAELGYLAFAIDMYGKGVRAKDAREAASMSGIYLANRQLMRSRAEAGLEVLLKNELVDVKRIAAIGYCFGGTTVLELARGGADIAGVVSFHGGLDTPNPGDARNIKGKILALHGADDPFVTVEQIAAFQDEMRKAGVDWQMVYYGGAVHSFTNPEADNYGIKGVAYNKKADRRSWEAMKIFFSERFR
ncbi:MAG: dienelactone hydrolase family protein [Nitrospirota bacterium]